ncbi:lytic transglycosylase domain-containing protein [Sphingorhabdus sp.]|uniref:lytic transglycosylase domain-containing protein n=1 Tax=Sphingorhabdus sp. TaxID=1902408 RepID=UPI00391D2DCA
MTGPISATAGRQRVTAAIADASARTGVAFDYLMDQAQLESGMRPDARAQTSSATGLYQFTNQTWLATLKRHGPAHGLDWASGAITQNRNGAYAVADPNMRSQILNLRTHPETAAVMAAELASDNNDYLQSRINANPEAVDLYLAHFLGAKGAGDFLNAMQADPNQAAAPLFPAAAAANRSIFYRPDGAARSLSDIRSGFLAKMDTAPSSTFPTNFSTQQRFATTSLRRAPLAMADMEKMPKGLDLDFARRAYQRLSGLTV